MSLRRLVLLRHGRTEWNATSRMQGRLDPELDAVGLGEAAAAAPRVAGYSPLVLVASDQLRAWATAAAVADVTGLVARADPRLRETSVGEWEGLTGDEVEHGWPGGLRAWRSDPTFAPPGGESRVQVSVRALPVVHELVGELDDGAVERDPLYPDPGSSALLVAHGGTIVALTAGLLGWPTGAWPTLQPLRNCHWGVLEHRLGMWRLATWGAR